jgi:hypothetical protein
MKKQTIQSLYNQVEKIFSMNGIEITPKSRLTVEVEINKNFNSEGTNTIFTLWYSQNRDEDSIFILASSPSILLEKLKKELNSDYIDESINIEF